LAAIFSFKCSSCGDLHEGSPRFGYDSPLYYQQLDQHAREACAEPGSDLCVIKDTDQIDRFIRVCLEIPIHGCSEPFVWGAWVSLSEASFNRYRDTWDEPDESDHYFGWFSNRLPLYPDTLNLKSAVRPLLELPASDHPLAIDLHAGISVGRAQELAELMIHGDNQPAPD
jgi:hypothetical protein